jgi:2-dehydropantoate 2-reductase
VEATRVEPGVIEHASPFADVTIASSTAPRARVEEVARMLVEAGFTARVAESEAVSLWSKMGLLAPMALLTTRYMQPVGEIREQHGAELSAAIREVAAIAAAFDVTLDVEAIEGLFHNVPGAMKSSMQRDAEAGRELEIDAIGGAALRAAAMRGVSVPVLTELVLALASR